MIILMIISDVDKTKLFASKEVFWNRALFFLNLNSPRAHFIFLLVFWMEKIVRGPPFVFFLGTV